MSNPKSLRIVYMGTPDFAVAPLAALYQGGYNVVAVVTMPDKPAGRGLKLKGSAVKEYAESVGIPLLQPEKLSSPEFIDELKALNLDLGIVVAFKMLPTSVWSLPRLGTFNLHASLLPDYRGAAPINWAIINGDSVSGVTTFMLRREIDTGDVIARESVEISADDTAGTLHDRLMELGARLVPQSVDIVAEGAFVATPQSEITGSAERPAPKIFREDCKIDWNNSCVDIYNKVRGLSPYPAAWCELKGDSYKLFRVEYSQCVGSTIGDIICDGVETLKVGCADGYIIIKELQQAGKRRMEITELLRGNKF